MSDGPVHTQGRRVAHLTYTEDELGMEHARPVREVAVEIDVDPDRSYGDTAEILYHARRLFGRSTGEDRTQELLERLGRYRETLDQVRGLLESLSLYESPVHLAQLASAESKIRELFEDDPLPADVHVLGVRVFLDPERYKHDGGAVREYLQGAVRDVQELTHAPNAPADDLPAGLINYEDYRAVALVPLENPLQEEGRLRDWFQSVTGWTCSPGEWSEEMREHAAAFQTVVDDYVETARGAPDRALQSVDTLYQEAMSFPGIHVPAPFAEGVQSFRHSGRRPA